MDSTSCRSSDSPFLYSRGNRDSTFCHWLSNIRLSRIILCILIVLVTIPIITHYYLSNVGSAQSDSFHSRSKLDFPDDSGSIKVQELKVRIEEMTHIKISVNNELRELESKRQKLQSEISSFGDKVENLKTEVERKANDLERIKLSISQAEVAHREILERNQPELGTPAKISLKSLNDILPMPSSAEEPQCSIYSCVDFLKCSLVSDFPVYVYPLAGQGFNERISASLSQTFNYNPHITTEPLEACVFIYVNYGKDNALGEKLMKLPYWGGDGRNHIIFNIATSTEDSFIVRTSSYGRAMIAQSVFHSYRPHFDLLVPPLLGPPGSDVWYDLPSITPARRRYLISFSAHSSANSSNILQKALEKLQASKTSDEFYFEFQCSDGNGQRRELGLCGSTGTRAALLKQSTFVLIFLTSSNSDLTTIDIQLRLYEALKMGAVPIVVGNHNLKFVFPYEDVVDWHRALVPLAESRLPELHFLARAVTDRDILAFRRQGRILWEKYFGSIQSIVDSIIAVYRQRIGVPPPPINDEPSPSIFNATFKVIT